MLLRSLEIYLSFTAVFYKYGAQCGEDSRNNDVEQYGNQRENYKFIHDKADCNNSSQRYQTEIDEHYLYD